MMLIKILILPYIRCGSFLEGCITKFSRLTTKSSASPFIRYMKTARRKFCLTQSFQLVRRDLEEILYSNDGVSLSQFA